MIQQIQLITIHTIAQILQVYFSVYSLFIFGHLKID